MVILAIFHPPCDSPRFDIRDSQSPSGKRLYQIAAVKASPPLKTVSFPPVLTHAYLLPPKKSSEFPVPNAVSVLKVPFTLVP